MRIKRALQEDQDFIARFIAVLGKGLTIAAHSKVAKPGFFMRAGQFIREFVEPIYFRKEELLLQALEDCGFPPDEGPVGSMRSGQKKAAGISNMLIDAAHQWSQGDEMGRGDVVWATSEYTGQMRQHLELLRTRIYPLLEQSISPEDEQALSARVNHLDFGSPMSAIRDKYLKIVESMEEEVSDWR